MKTQHLNIIQGVINRMAQNSFSLKGWAVTLATAIVALASKDTDKIYFIVAYIPIIVFWGLDSYYLMQERLFRSLYNKVRELEEEQIDFNMDTSSLKSNKKNKYNSCMTSVTEIGFYLPLAAVTASVIIIRLVF